MKYYFTSDTHFNHKRVIDFGHRPFRNLKHMSEELVRRWNLRVTADDTVFIVGDFNFKGVTSNHKLFRKLNGNKVLIHGNHDSHDFLLGCYIRMLNKEWEVVHNPDDSSHTRVIHGHIHLPHAKRIVKQKNGRTLINVNCELWNYEPVSVKQIAKEIQKVNKQ